MRAVSSSGAAAMVSTAATAGCRQPLGINSKKRMAAWHEQKSNHMPFPSALSCPHYLKLGKRILKRVSTFLAGPGRGKL